MPECFIATTVLEAIADHAQEAWPDECCGLLIGRDRRVLASRRARNRSADPYRRFLLDPADQFAAIRVARASGLHVIGAYHSHPRSEPVPSPTDAREADPALLHVIVRPNGIGRPAEVRAWRLDGGNFRECPFVPLP